MAEPLRPGRPDSVVDLTEEVHGPTCRGGRPRDSERVCGSRPLQMGHQKFKLTSWPQVRASWLCRQDRKRGGGFGWDIRLEQKFIPRTQAVTQTPSTGLRHPSFKEEGAGKRCSECGRDGGTAGNETTWLVSHGRY